MNNIRLEITFEYLNCKYLFKLLFIKEGYKVFWTIIIHIILYYYVCEYKII